MSDWPVRDTVTANDETTKGGQLGNEEGREKRAPCSSLSPLTGSHSDLVGDRAGTATCRFTTSFRPLYPQEGPDPACPAPYSRTLHKHCCRGYYKYTQQTILVLKVQSILNIFRLIVV